MKKFTIYYFPMFFMVLLFISCNQNKEIASTEILNSELYKEGAALIAQNCISCHAPQGNMENRIAPPLVAIKDHYSEGNVDESTFKKSMVEFLQKPDILISKMPKAIDKFGLMPKLGYTKEQYEAVATYIYHTEMDRPGWYKEHHKDEEKNMMKYSDNGSIDYLKSGMNLALATKAVLGKNLLTAIKEKGTDGALDFCNTRAIHLTDSMSMKLNTSIKRVSDKNRNPENKANESEMEYIKLAKAEIEEEGKATPKVFENNDKMIGYYPITTNNMCMQCHGQAGTEVKESTLALLEKHYPEDKATGYSPDMLRGIWVVEMDKITD